MSDRENAETNSDDNPLFVLKYRNGSTAAFVTACLVLASICGIALFAMPLDRSSLVRSFLEKLAFGFMFLVFLSALIELTLFNEIRLYSDRIVKVRRFLRDTEVDLADATSVSQIGGGWLRHVTDTAPDSAALLRHERAPQKYQGSEY
jgi:hypothetical protein